MKKIFLSTTLFLALSASALANTVSISVGILPLNESIHAECAARVAKISAACEGSSITVQPNETVIGSRAGDRYEHCDAMLSIENGTLAVVTTKTSVIADCGSNYSKPENTIVENARVEQELFGSRCIIDSVTLN